MTKLVVDGGILAVLLAVYLIEVRPFLKRQAAFAPIFGREAVFWDKLKGARTIICASLAAIVPMVPDLIQALTGIDFVALGVPDQAAKGIGAGLAIAAVFFRVKA